MATREELKQAAREAYVAGDTDRAKQIADLYHSMPLTGAEASPITHLGGMIGKNGQIRRSNGIVSDIADIGRNLQSYKTKYGASDIPSVISHWSPPRDNKGNFANDTPKLIKNAYDFTKGQLPEKFDLDDPHVQKVMTAAILQQEHSMGRHPEVVSTLNKLYPTANVPQPTNTNTDEVDLTDKDALKQAAREAYVAGDKEMAKSYADEYHHLVHTERSSLANQAIGAYEGSKIQVQKAIAKGAKSLGYPDVANDWETDAKLNEINRTPVETTTDEDVKRAEYTDGALGKYGALAQQKLVEPLASSTVEYAPVMAGGALATVGGIPGAVAAGGLYGLQALQHTGSIIERDEAHRKEVEANGEQPREEIPAGKAFATGAVETAYDVLIPKVVGGFLGRVGSMLGKDAAKVATEKVTQAADEAFTTTLGGRSLEALTVPEKEAVYKAAHEAAIKSADELASSRSWKRLALDTTKNVASSGAGISAMGLANEAATRGAIGQEAMTGQEMADTAMDSAPLGAMLGVGHTIMHNPMTIPKRMGELQAEAYSPRNSPEYQQAVTQREAQEQQAQQAAVASTPYHPEQAPEHTWHHLNQDHANLYEGRNYADLPEEHKQAFEEAHAEGFSKQAKDASYTPSKNIKEAYANIAQKLPENAPLDIDEWNALTNHRLETDFSNLYGVPYEHASVPIDVTTKFNKAYIPLSNIPEVERNGRRHTAFAPDPNRLPEFNGTKPQAPVQPEPTQPEPTQPEPTQPENIIPVHTPETLRYNMRKATKPYGSDWVDKTEATGKLKFATLDETQKQYPNAGIDEKAQSFFDPNKGEVHFIADNIAEGKDLHGLLLHEVAAHALKMGESDRGYHEILKHADRLVKGNSPTALKVREALINAQTPAEQVPHEQLAYLLEYHPDLPISQRAIAWFRQAVRKISGSRLANKLTENDLVYMATRALRNAPEKLSAMRSEPTSTAPQEPIIRPKPAPAPQEPTIRPKPAPAPQEPTPYGREVSLVSPDNTMRVKARYEVLPSAEVIASHKTDLTQNPKYPQELQPRKREAKSYALDTAKKIANFNPDLVGESATTDTGAPLIDAHNNVISGNGRAMVIGRIHQVHKGKTKTYKDWLLTNADKFGLDKKTIAGIDKPMLVRRLTEDQSADLNSLARKSNMSAVKEMSQVEQAFSDAKSLPDETLHGDHVKQFVKHTGADNLYDESGSLSQKGINRIEAATMAKTYENEKLVADLFETTDTEVKGLLKALNNVAPDWLSMRHEAKKAGLTDLTSNLVDAVMLVKKARMSSKDTIKSLLYQRDMNKDTISPITENFVKLFYHDDALTRPVSAEKVAYRLKEVAHNIEGSLAHEDVFGEKTPPEKILQGVVENKDSGEGHQELLFSKLSPEEQRLVDRKLTVQGNKAESTDTLDTHVKQFWDKFAGITNKVAPYIDIMTPEGKYRADKVAHSYQQGFNVVSYGIKHGGVEVTPYGILGGVDLHITGADGRRKTASLMNVQKEVDKLGANGRQMFANVAVVLDSVSQAKRDPKKLGAKYANNMALLWQDAKDAKTLIDRHPELQDALKMWRVVNQQLIKVMHDSGLINAETAKIFADNSDYFPRFVLKEEIANPLGVDNGNSVQIGNTHTKIFRERVASDHEVNVFENMAKHYATTSMGAYANLVKTATCRDLSAVGAAKRVGIPGTKYGEQGDTAVMVDGKRQFYKLDDPTDLPPLMVMMAEMNRLGKVLTGTTQVLRTGALSNFRYIIKEWVRNPIYASLASDIDILPPHAAIRELFRMGSGDMEVFTDLQKDGQIGLIQGGSGVHDMRDFMKNIGDALEEDPKLYVLGKTKNARQYIKNVMHASSILTDATTKMAVYRAALKTAERLKIPVDQRKAYARMAARESLNFAIQGSRDMTTHARRLVPFISAEMNSLLGLKRAMSGTDIPLARRKEYRARFIKKVGVYAMLAGAYAMLKVGDPQWQAMTDEHRYASILLPYPDPNNPHIAFAIPPELVFINAIPTMMVEAYAKTRTGNQMMRAASHIILNTIPAGIGKGMPNIAFAKPVVEAYANHNSTFGREIESSAMKNFPVANRGQANASHMANRLSRAGLDKIGLSPILVDHIFNGYFADLGQSMQMLADKVIPNPKGVPNKPRKDYDIPFARMASMLVPATESQAVQDFYTYKGEADRMKHQEHYLRTMGEIETAKEYRKDNAKKINMASDVDAKAKQISTIRKQMDRVQHSNVSDEVKKERLRPMQKRLNAIAVKEVNRYEDRTMK